MIGELGPRHRIHLDHLQRASILGFELIQRRTLNCVARGTAISAEEEDRRTPGPIGVQPQGTDPDPRQVKALEDPVGHDRRSKDEDRENEALDHLGLSEGAGGRRPGRAPAGGVFVNQGAPSRLSQ